MDAKDLFNAYSKSTAELLSETGQFFYIPAYQRQYTWSAIQVNELIASVVHALNSLSSDSDSYAFLGTTIVIEDEHHETISPLHIPDLPPKVFLVIDGQQRITTLLILLVAIHSQLRDHYEFQQKITAATKTESDIFLEHETSEMIHEISRMIIEMKHRPGKSEAPYVRVIRAYYDCWSKSDQDRKYDSPIAGLIYDYAIGFDGINTKVKKQRFNPRRHLDPQEQTVASRFNDIEKTLKLLLNMKGILEENLSLPPISKIGSKNFKTALFPNSTNEALSVAAKIDNDSPQAVNTRLLILAKFLLYRVALTVVEVKKEEYAFAVFDTLNTTGQPLAPFETFKPLVMKAVGLSNYQSSRESIVMENIAKKLGNLDDDSNRKNALQLTINFALAECGHTLGKNLSTQRTFFRNSFREVAHSPQDRLEYIHLFNTIVSLKKSIWADTGRPRLPDDHLYSISAETRINLSLIAKLDHTIVLAILARFWREVEKSDLGSVERVDALRSFERVVESIAAFTTLYRGISGTTDGIEQVYRQVVAGINSPHSCGSLQRASKDFYGEDVPNLQDLNAEDFCIDLGKRLTFTGHRGISNKSAFVAAAKSIPIYKKSVVLARYMLFVANHDCVGDPNVPGLLAPGGNGCNPVFKLDYWADSESTTVEHIAPQSQSGGGWDSMIYDPSNLNLKHTIGNLTLCPKEINSILGNEPWLRKGKAYSALGSQLPLQKIRSRLLEAHPPFTRLADTIDGVKVRIDYCPFFSNIGDKSDDWTADFIETRSENILGLVWDRLAPKLGL
jgi:hypothetical protein